MVLCTVNEPAEQHEGTLAWCSSCSELVTDACRTADHPLQSADSALEEWRLRFQKSVMAKEKTKMLVENTETVKVDTEEMMNAIESLGLASEVIMKKIVEAAVTKKAVEVGMVSAEVMTEALENAEVLLEGSEGALKTSVKMMGLVEGAIPSAKVTLEVAEEATMKIEAARVMITAAKAARDTAEAEMKTADAVVKVAEIVMTAVEVAKHTAAAVLKGVEAARHAAELLMTTAEATTKHVGAKLIALEGWKLKQAGGVELSARVSCLCDNTSEHTGGDIRIALVSQATQLEVMDLRIALGDMELECRPDSAWGACCVPASLLNALTPRAEHGHLPPGTVLTDGASVTVYQCVVEPGEGQLAAVLGAVTAGLQSLVPDCGGGPEEDPGCAPGCGPCRLCTAALEDVAVVD